jgi:hypothetical protein
MRQISPLIRVALLGAAFFIGAAPAAFADPVAPTVLVPALDVYIDYLVSLHNAPVTCTGAKPTADYVGNWDEAKAIFLSSLWANGFPTDFVRTATTRLDAPRGATKSDCADPAAVAYLADPSKADWVSVIENSLKGIELHLVTTPVDDKTWAAIKAMVAKDLPAQQRFLDCIAVSDSIILPNMVHDWDDMIVQLGGKLVGAGLPHDEINAMLSGAEANSLWHRATPDAEAQLRASCAKDPSWQNRLEDFSFAGVGPEAAKLLPAPPAPADSDSD